MSFLDDIKSLAEQVGNIQPVPYISQDDILQWMEESKSQIIVEYREAGCNFQFEDTARPNRHSKWGLIYLRSNLDTLYSEYALRTMVLPLWIVPVSKMFVDGRLNSMERNLRNSQVRGAPYLRTQPTCAFWNSRRSERD